VNKGINSDLLNIRSFLTEDAYKFLIPDFQRDFVWGKEETQQLLDDLSEDTNGFALKEDDIEGYLLGNIVLIKPADSERYLVVDGQQRLTTTTLICKALEELVEDKISKSENTKETRKWQMKLTDILQSYAILDNDDEIKDTKLMHDQSLNFGKVYQNILLNKEYEAVLESELKIEEVYNTAKEYLENLDDDQLKNFISYFKSRVYFIVTTSTSYNKAFQLFEVLNDRGRSLEPLDLVKNLFLKTLSKDARSNTDVDEFNTNWNHFILNLQLSPKKKIASSTFLKHYIIGKFGVNIKKDLVYDFFDKKKLSSDEISNLVKDLKNVSKTYAEIEKKNYTVFLDDTKMFIIFKLFNIKQLHSLLIPFYGSDTQIKERILNIGVRLGASVLFSFTQMNFIESTLPIILERYFENIKSGTSKEEAFDKLEEEANKIIKGKSSDILQLLPLKKLENANGRLSTKASVILKFIELYFHGNGAVIVPANKQKITVEHILSKEVVYDVDFRDAGFDTMEDFDNHKNLIGNLTLLYNNDNSSIGNKKFQDKMKLYKEQDFIITQRIAKEISSTTKGGKSAIRAQLVNENESAYKVNINGHFSKESIRERSAEIANLICNLVNNNLQNK